MGVYFRKRIPIGKWFHINLSKSGAGLSFGRKGATISAGKRGVFFNWGIPGTGIYSRKRLAGPKSKNRQASRNSTSNCFGLNWSILLILALINLILGFLSKSDAAYITAGIFVILGVIVFLVQNAKTASDPSQQNNQPQPGARPAVKALLTKEMVSRLPSNESKFLVNQKPLVDAVLKELRANGSISAPIFSKNSGYDSDTVDAVLYLLGKMNVVTLSNISSKIWSVN